MLYRMSYDIMWDHATSCNITSHHITPRHVTQSHVTSRCVTSCRVTSFRGTKGVPRKGVWTSVNIRVWTCKELRVRHDRTGCYLRPLFLGAPSVPSGTSRHIASGRITPYCWPGFAGRAPARRRAARSSLPTPPRAEWGIYCADSDWADKNMLEPSKSALKRAAASSVRPLSWVSLLWVGVRSTSELRFVESRCADSNLWVIFRLDSGSENSSLFESNFQKTQISKLKSGKYKSRNSSPKNTNLETRETSENSSRTSKKHKSRFGDWPRQRPLVNTHMYVYYMYAYIYIYIYIHIYI